MHFFKYFCCVWLYYLCAVAGSAFRQSSIIYLARHVLSGSAVVIRRCNADLLSDEELQQLAVSAETDLGN